MMMENVRGMMEFIAMELCNGVKLFRGCHPEG